MVYNSLLVILFFMFHYFVGPLSNYRQETTFLQKNSHNFVGSLITRRMQRIVFRVAQVLSGVIVLDENLAYLKVAFATAYFEWRNMLVILLLAVRPVFAQQADNT